MCLLPPPLLGLRCLTRHEVRISLHTMLARITAPVLAPQQPVASTSQKCTTATTALVAAALPPRRWRKTLGSSLRLQAQCRPLALPAVRLGSLLPSPRLARLQIAAGAGLAHPGEVILGDGRQNRGRSRAGRAVKLDIVVTRGRVRNAHDWPTATAFSANPCASSPPTDSQEREGTNDALSSSSLTIPATCMAKGLGSSGGAATLQRSKLSNKQSVQQTGPKLDDGHGGGNIGKNIHNGGGGDGGDGDDDDYFNNFGERVRVLSREVLVLFWRGW